MADKEITVPIHTLDPCPWNPKNPINSVYKVGLRASLEYFNIRDRLKVWPVPGKKGRYFILNGNQRILLIKEVRQDAELARHFGLTVGDDGRPDPKALQKLKNDPVHAELLREIANKVLQSTLEVQVMDMDQDDAILFNASFDRNRSQFDEAKTVLSVERITSRSADLIKRLVRPDKGLVNPLPPPPVPLSGSRSAPDPADAVPFVPSNDVEAKYGPPPPPEPDPSVSRPQGIGPEPPAALIPTVIALSPQGHKYIFDTVFRMNSRMHREAKLKDAVGQFAAACGRDGEECDLSDVIIETMLLTLNRHARAAEEVAAKAEKPAKTRKF